MTLENAFDILYHAALNSNRARFVGRPAGQTFGSCRFCYTTEEVRS